MGRLPRSAIQRTRGGFRINLDVQERELIHRLLGELRTLLDESCHESDGGDARLRRLFPSAYHQATDRELDEEFRRLMRSELVASRLAGLDVVSDSLAPNDRRAPELTETQMMAFLQALNGVRLVLGTMLDVSEEPGEISADHPMSGEYQLYDFLSWVLDSSVRAVQG